MTTGLLVSQGKYDGISIANIRVENPQQLELLRSVGIRSLACFDHAGPTPMLLDDEMIKFVQKHHIEYEIVETNIDRRLKEFDQQREVARNRGLGGWYSDYKTWTEVNEKITLLANSAPDIASTFLVGTSHEGRSIHGIKITGPGDSSNRPSVLFNGCQHAREWIAVMVPVFVAEQLIAGWDDDPEIRSLLESTQSGGILGDVNCGGVANVTDVLAIVSEWGDCALVCNEDIVPDGTIDVSDLLQVIGNW